MKAFYVYSKRRSLAPRLFSCLSIEFARHFVLKRFQNTVDKIRTLSMEKKNNEKVSQSEKSLKAGTLHISICGKSATTLVSNSETK